MHKGVKEKDGAREKQAGGNHNQICFEKGASALTTNQIRGLEHHGLWGRSKIGNVNGEFKGKKKH